MQADSVRDDASPPALLDAEAHWSPEPIWVSQRFWRGVFYGALLSLPCWVLILSLLKIM